jgi:predicted nucleic-acid-binding protein
MKMPRADVARIVRDMLSHPRYQVEDADLFREAVEIFESAVVEFADVVALTDARHSNCPLYTFDRKLARMSGARAVELR